MLMYFYSHIRHRLCVQFFQIWIVLFQLVLNIGLQLERRIHFCVIEWVASGIFLIVLNEKNVCSYFLLSWGLWVHLLLSNVHLATVDTAVAQQNTSDCPIQAQRLKGWPSWSPSAFSQPSAVTSSNSCPVIWLRKFLAHSKLSSPLFS